jgi:glycosyltransferase 2 family protein
MPTRFWNTNGFRVIVGTLISIVFLVLAVKDVPLGDVAQALARVNFVWVLIAIAAMLAQSWLRTVRWIQLYYPVQKGLRVPQMFGIVTISQMLNIAVPWRVGELARIYLVSEIAKRSKAQTLATLGIEKFFDTLMLLALLLLIPPFMTLPNWLEQPREGIIVLTLALFVVAFALLVLRAHLLRLLERVHLPWSQKSLGELTHLALGSLDVLKKWDLHLRLQGLSILIWLMGVVVNDLTFRALGIALPFIASFLLMAVLQVGGIVPSSPGKIGVFQALCIVTLALFGIDKSMGLTVGILLYLIAYGTPVILGILFLWWGGVNLQRITGSEGEPG